MFITSMKTRFSSSLSPFYFRFCKYQSSSDMCFSSNSNPVLLNFNLLSNFAFTFNRLAVKFCSSSSLAASIWEIQNEAYLSSLVDVSMFSGKATILLRRMLAERNSSFQGKRIHLDKTLKGLCITGRLKEAIGVLWRSGLQVETQTYALLLQECINRKEYTKGKRIHAQMVVVGFAPDKYLNVKLLILYAKSGNLQTAESIFLSLPVRDLIPWNTMIAGYVQKGCEQEGLYMYYHMRQNRVLPDQYTFASVFRACSALASLEHGMRAHAVLIKSSITSNVIVDSALVDMYFKCSSLSDGHKVFNYLSTRNVITWTSLISGYGYHGKVSEVLKCFDKMKKDHCRPNFVTFLVVLTACSHGGLVDEGQEHFNSMKRDYEIEPKGQHYAAMVDMLGRAGRLKEAYEVVLNSPCKEHAPLWGSLLAACRTHGNVELLEVAARKYFELEPENGGNYVVFANGYASCGLYEAASKVRKRMESSGVKKDPAYSWIEVKGEVHRFMMGDYSHKLSRKMLKMVQEITSVLMYVDCFSDELDASGLI